MTDSLSARVEWLIALASVLAAIFNAVLICYNFAQRPARDASIPYNLTQLVLVWAELAILIIFFGRHCVNLVFNVLHVAGRVYPPLPALQWLHLSGVPVAAVRLANVWLDLSDCIDALAFNSLKFVPMILPGKMWAAVKHKMHLAQDIDAVQHPAERCKAWSVMIAKVGDCVLFLCLGVLGLVLKLSQIAFVGTATVEQWSGAQWLLLAGFINNMVALTNANQDITDMLHETLQGPSLTAREKIITAFLSPEEHVRWHTHSHVERVIVGTLVQQFGWRGFMWYRGLAPADITALTVQY